MILNNLLPPPSWYVDHAAGILVPIKLKIDREEVKPVSTRLDVKTTCEEL